MAEVLGIENDTNLSTDDMAKIFQEKSDKGEVTSAEVCYFFFLSMLIALITYLNTFTYSSEHL